MSNPYFSNDPYFGESEQARKQRQALGVPQHASPQAANPQYGTPQYGSPQFGTPQYGSSTGTLPPVPAPADQLEHAYAMPSATAYDTGRMTYDDVIVKTGLVLGTIVLFGAFAWFGPTHPDTWNPPGPRHGYWWSDLPCRGCDRTECPHWSCLPALEPGTAARRVLEHLEHHGT